jgi:AcrR family transcriptional regulator
MAVAKTGGAGKGKVARREMILEALGEELKRKPLAELSVEEIAEASGITRQRFYHYFPTKYEALAALLDEVSDRLMEVYIQPGSWFVRPPGVKPRDALLPTFEAVMEFWIENGHILREGADLWNLPESVRTHWYRFMGRMVDFTALQIQRERDEGVAPAGPDPHFLASQLQWMGERLAFLETAGAPPAIGLSGEAFEASADFFLRVVYLDDDPQLPPGG